VKNKVRIGALFYKIGIHGKVFWLGDDGWFLSQKPVSEIKAAMEGEVCPRTT
jgi:hypothetical protein